MDKELRSVLRRYVNACVFVAQLHGSYTAQEVKAAFERRDSLKRELYQLLEAYERKH